MKNRMPSLLAISSMLTSISALLYCFATMLTFVSYTSGLVESLPWIKLMKLYLMGLTLIFLGLAWYQKSNKIICFSEDNEKVLFWQSKIFLGIVTALTVIMLMIYFFPRVLVV